MLRSPPRRPRHPRTRRSAAALAVAAGLTAPLLAVAWSAAASPGATCDASTHTVSMASGGTATIVRSGDKITVPGCGGTGSVLGSVGSVNLVTVAGGGPGGTLTIDLTGGPFPSSVRFDVDLSSAGAGAGVHSGQAGTLDIVGSGGPDDIVAGSFGIALNGDEVVDVGSGCNPSCVGPPAVDEVTIEGGGGDDALSAAGSFGTGAASEAPVVLDGGSGVNTLDFSRAAGPVTANLFQHTASGAKRVTNFQRILGSPFSDELIGDHDNYIADGAGDDVVFAGAGNNVIDSGPGSKAITVGNGDNLITVGPGSGDTISAGDGNNVIHGSDGGDAITVGNGANVIVDGGGDDSITTGDGPNQISGADGDDHIKVGNGDNLIDGGAGDEQLYLGDGRDTVIGGPGDNVIYGGQGPEHIDAGPGANVIYLGDGGNDVTAGDGENIIHGGRGGDV
ncbi:MAG TPA: calcium-binding protein, partial [Acidimicrobiia bacterium]|nr:calcium-binding protein [Acidimicrobiia bacterium]